MTATGVGDVAIATSTALEARGPAWSAALQTLSTIEHARLAATADEDDRRRFVTGRWELRRLAATRLGVAASSVRVTARCADCGGPHGVPLVSGPDGRRLAASVTHTGTRVMVAVAGAGRVGLDLVGPGEVDFAGFDDAALHPSELSAREATTPDARSCWRARVWAAKEAALKATGVGLTVAPSTVRLERPGADGAGRAWVPLDGGYVVVGVRPIDAPAGHAAALATWHP